MKILGMLLTLGLVACASNPIKNFETLESSRGSGVESSPVLAIKNDKPLPLQLATEFSSELTTQDRLIYLDKPKNVIAPYKLFSFSPDQDGSFVFEYKSAAQIVGFGNGSVVCPVIYLLDRNGKTIEMKRSDLSYQPLKGVGRYHLFVNYAATLNKKGAPYFMIVAADTQLRGQSIGAAEKLNYPVGVIQALAQELKSQQIIPNVYGNFDIKVTAR